MLFIHVYIVYIASSLLTAIYMRCDRYDPSVARSLSEHRQCIPLLYRSRAYDTEIKDSTIVKRIFIECYCKSKIFPAECGSCIKRKKLS